MGKLIRSQGAKKSGICLAEDQMGAYLNVQNRYSLSKGVKKTSDAKATKWWYPVSYKVKICLDY
jgi:hypothetical protein